MLLLIMNESKNSSEFVKFYEIITDLIGIILKKLYPILVPAGAVRPKEQVLAITAGFKGCVGFFGFIRRENSRQYLKCSSNLRKSS